jgi:hypothetical protein
MEDLMVYVEAEFVSERNDAGLKELSEQTSDSSAFLNAATCLSKCVLNCEQRFQFFVFRSGLSDIRITESLLHHKTL